MDALEKAIKKINSPGAKIRASEKEADRKRAGRRVAQRHADFASGRRNALLEIFENMPGKYADGGEAVPKKYKGFSKLPETVQERISPDLASKYEYGGEVSGSGKKAGGRNKGNCRGMGAAMRGGRFAGCK